MSLQPKVSVVTIMYNERRHIEHFFKQFTLPEVNSWLGEIVVLDGGSTDGTVDALERWQGLLPIHYEVRPQPKDPFCTGWEEGNRRNWTLEQAGFPWILMVDTDEILDDEILKKAIPSAITRPDTQLAGFDRVNYFKDAYHVWDFPGERGTGGIPRLWQNKPTIRYDDAPLHCTVRDSGEPLRNMLSGKGCFRIGMAIHHLHRMMWPGKDTYIEYAAPGTAVEVKVPETTLQTHLKEGKVVEYNGPWPRSFYTEGWVT